MREFAEATILFFKSRLRGVGFYTVNIVMTPIEIFVEALVFIFMAYLISPAMSPYLSEYGTINYVKYVIVATIFSPFSGYLTNFFYSMIIMTYWHKTLPKLSFSRVGIYAYAASFMLYGLIIRAVESATIIAIGYYFGLTMSLSDLGLVVLLAILALISNIGLGLIGASTFILLNARKGNPVATVKEILVRLFSGLYIPLSIFPREIRLISYLVPETFLFDIARRLFLKRELIVSPEVIKQISLLLLYTILTLAIGFYLFKKAVKKAWRTGLLLQWT